MTALSDDALRALMGSDPASGWRAFIDQYTPLIVGLIRRAGLVDRDEVMEVYVRVCEHLSARGFERLKSQDASRGSLGGWLAVIVRHAIVDWVRSRKGRRRLFQAVRGLEPFDRKVFELHYWDDRSPSEIAELLATDTGGQANLSSVFAALDRVHSRLSDRHRAELVALAARSRWPVPLGETDAAERMPDPHADPEATVRGAQLNARFETAIGGLPAGDAAIVRLKYVEGLSNRDIEHALGIAGLTASRIQDILTRLRTALANLGVDAIDAASARVRFLESEQS